MLDRNIALLDGSGKILLDERVERINKINDTNEYELFTKSGMKLVIGKDIIGAIFDYRKPNFGKDQQINS
jgi:hypothetical protein